jgi:RimJ/RimL family protein N-acetyltransferase
MEPGMSADLLTGSLVRLKAEDPEMLRKAIARWERDSTFQRQLDSEPTAPMSPDYYKQWIKDDLPRPDQLPTFAIHILADDRMIGFCGLHTFRPSLRDSFLGIGIGEAEFRGQGYGTDAMRVLQRYAFREAGLARLSLTVYGYNPRAIRSYEKTGFREEGRLRNALNREGRRWDEIYMGILRSEWEQQT